MFKRFFCVRIKKLVTPIDYLFIDSKPLRFYKFYAPCFFVLIAISLYYLLPNNINLISSKNGLISEINTTVSILLGFFIASLLAVPIFRVETLDEKIKGSAMTLEKISEGEKKLIELTRRNFLCYLFGYCAFISMMILIMGVLTKVLYPALSTIDKHWVNYAITPLWLILYFFMLSSLFVTTLLGLHYLVDRIHR